MEAGNRVIVRSDAAGCTRGPGGREFGGVGLDADSAVKERARDLRRSESAEQQWARFMERGASRGGFMEADAVRIRDLFN